MRKILLIVLVVWAGSLWAKELIGTPSQETREFEFELTDLYYPLLNDSQNQEMRSLMPHGAYIFANYSGVIIESADLKNWVDVVMYGGTFRGKAMASDRFTVQNAVVSGTKLRFKVPKTVNKDSDGYCYHERGDIPIEGFDVYLPIDHLTAILGGKLPYHEYLDQSTRYIGFSFNIVPYKEDPESTQHRYVIDFKVPWVNLIHRSSMINNYHSGAHLWAVMKVSEVNKDGTLSTQPLVANKNEYDGRYLYDQPLISNSIRMNSIPSADVSPYATRISQDGIDITLKTLPKSVRDVKARFIKHNALQQYTLYAPVRYSAASGKYDENLSNFYFSATKTRGELFKIEGSSGYQAGWPGYGNETLPDCIFDYGIEFRASGTWRYFRYPANNDHLTKKNYQYAGHEKSRVVVDIEKDGIAALDGYEQNMRKWYSDQKDSEAKIAACMQVLDHARHILSSTDKALSIEFDRDYAAIEKVHNKHLKNGFLVVGKKNGKPFGESITYYEDGRELHSTYKADGSQTSASMYYPNGNRFEYKNDKVGFTSPIYYGALRSTQEKVEAICEAKQFVDGKAEGEGYLDIKSKKFGYRFRFTGNFTHGVADGKAYLDLIFSNALLHSEFYRDVITVKDGKFTGGTTFHHSGELNSEGERAFVAEYKVVFKDGKIVSGMEPARMKRINDMITSIYPIACDINIRLGIGE